MSYDRDLLARLGKRRQALQEQLREVTQQIEAEVTRAIGAGLDRGDQAEIARLTSMTRETIARMAIPREQRWRKDRQT